jgi:SAM-dependent methyltransferase
MDYCRIEMLLHLSPGRSHNGGMEERDTESARRIRSLIEGGAHTPAGFRAALLAVAPAQRDAWVDAVFGIEGIPDDGPELPPGCVPYLPCAVDAVLRAIERAAVRASDVVIDIGAGAGRTAALLHLLTGAGVIGIEIQPALVRAGRELAESLRLQRVSFVSGNATDLVRFMMIGSVFFLNCPFSGERLAPVLADLEAIARTRPIRLCCVDLPLPPLDWLTVEGSSAGAGDLTIYTSNVTMLPATQRPSVDR